MTIKQKGRANDPLMFFIFGICLIVAFPYIFIPLIIIGFAITAAIGAIVIEYEKWKNKKQQVTSF